MRRICTGMAALAAGLVLHCAQVGAETIRFGGILPLTGPGALIGTAEMRGVQFAVDQANARGGVHGNPVEVQFEDNQAKPDQSILSFNKLTDLQHVAGDLHRLFRPDAGDGAAGDTQEGAAGQRRRAGRRAGEGLALPDQHAADDRRRDRGDLALGGRRGQEEGWRPVRERRRRHRRTRRLPEVVCRGRRHHRRAGGDRSSARPTSARRC